MPRQSKTLTEAEIDEINDAMRQHEQLRAELFEALNAGLREIGGKRDHRIFVVCDKGGYSTQRLVAEYLGWSPGTISALKHRRGVHKHKPS